MVVAGAAAAAEEAASRTARCTMVSPRSLSFSSSRQSATSCATVSVHSCSQSHGHGKEHNGIDNLFGQRCTSRATKVSSGSVSLHEQQFVIDTQLGVHVSQKCATAPMRTSVCFS